MMSSPEEVAVEIYGGKPEDYRVILPSDLDDFKTELKKWISKYDAWIAKKDLLNFLEGT